MISKASLRIISDRDLEHVSKQLGLTPSSFNKKGEINIIGRIQQTNVWGISSPLDTLLPLEDHLKWLAELVSDKKSTIEQIKRYANVDVFCSITANEQDGFSLSPKALSVFVDLQVDMEVSLILADATIDE